MGSGDTAGGRRFDELFSRIDLLETAFTDVVGAESGSEESRYLRKVLAEAFAVIDEMRDEFKKIWVEMDMMWRKITHYEGENMTSSTPPFYNRERCTRL